jgi:hypothetical protein
MNHSGSLMAVVNGTLPVRHPVEFEQLALAA